MRGLCAMGFGRGEAAAALRRAHDQPDRAAELLIAQAESVHERGHGSRRRRVMTAVGFEVADAAADDDEEEEEAAAGAAGAAAAAAAEGACRPWAAAVDRRPAASSREAFLS